MSISRIFGHFLDLFWTRVQLTSPSPNLDSSPRVRVSSPDALRESNVTEGKVDFTKVSVKSKVNQVATSASRLETRTRGLESKLGLGLVRWTRVQIKSKKCSKICEIDIQSWVKIGLIGAAASIILRYHCKSVLYFIQN